MNVSDRIAKLRSFMEEKHIDAYVVPSADNHQSEYVGEHFKSREFITGFTGSAGTAVITKDAAGLWTDGRYFIQAEAQLAGSGVTLYRMGNAGVPTVSEYLDSVLPENGTLGFDGRVIAMQEGKDFAEQFSYKNIRIEYSYDLVDAVWEERPSLAAEPVFLLDEKFSGESTTSKLSRLRDSMRENGTDVHVLTTLDDIAWLLNIRGNDVMYSPLVLSYAVVTMSEVHLFIDESRLDEHVKSELKKDNVVFHPYNDIYTFVKDFDSNNTVLIDPARINYALYNNIPDSTKKVEKTNPTILYKAMKNDVEIENIKKAHVKDGVAYTKFMYWLKTSLGKEKMTEMSASDKLENLRAQQEGFLWPSFEPICAFKANAAMCHYTSSAETDCELTAGNLFLTDTGGNYYEGSTDITRTVALGEINDELKLHFTTVLRSMMNLSRAKFLYGCCGYNLDVLARQPMWELDLDYNHGTGHGVGYLLNIHEGPTGFRWRIRGHEAHPLEAGMVITDEPGIYIEGSHGIRTENELVVRKGEETEYGQFMYFEPITYVPIDLDAINPDLLREDEKAWLNAYHKQVYDIIAPHLTKEEEEWLRIYTREI